MKHRLKRTSNWIAANAKDIRTIIFIFLVALIILTFMNLVQAQNTREQDQVKQAAANAKVLKELAAQAKTRNNNVEKLIKDNAEQTLILCTIILRDSTNLTPAETTSIETICNQQIEQISDGFALSGGTSAGTTQNGGQSQGSSSNPTPTPAPAQSNNSQSPSTKR
jgi:K+-sensing histidine kinase KdpD